MNTLGAIVLIVTILIIMSHMSCLPIKTSDQILAFYFILIGIMDIYLNHIHDRFFTL